MKRRHWITGCLLTAALLIIGTVWPGLKSFSVKAADISHSPEKIEYAAADDAVERLSEDKPHSSELKVRRDASADTDTHSAIKSPGILRYCLIGGLLIVLAILFFVPSDHRREEHGRRNTGRRLHGKN